MVQQKSRQESLADEEKRESNKKNKILKKRLKSMKEYEHDDMSMPPDRRSKEQKLKDAKDALLSKGGEVKGYMGGGEVHMDDSPNSGLITTKGWGKSRAT